MRRINIRGIKPNGVLWIWGEQVRTIQLTKEDIRYLRWYHHDSSIARDVNVVEKPKKYQVAPDRNKYNHKCRTKNRINLKGIGKKIIIGSIAVSLVIGSILLINHSKNNDSEVTTVEVTMDDNYSHDEEETEVSEIKYNRADIIKHLCDIYQVDYNVVYNKLKEITNNFTSDEYLDGCISGVTCKGTDVHANNEEELLTYAVRAIKQIPERFGLDNSIRIHNGYNSGDDYYAQISDVCELLGLDRNLMYAIVRSETSFNSDLFENCNNPAGLRSVDGNSDWWRFETKEEGFLEFGMELLKYYRLIGEDPANIDAETISKIGAIHAPLSDGNNLWLPNVLECLEYAQNNENELFGGEEVHGLGR